MSDENLVESRSVGKMRHADFSCALRKYLRKRQQINPRFSNRFLARKLRVSPAHISMILNGKRRPSLTLLQGICRLLDIDRETEDQLRLEILRSRDLSSGMRDAALTRKLEGSRVENGHQLASERQTVALKSWIYFAIMQTTLLRDYDGSPAYIARFLGLDADRIAACLQELAAVGLVRLDGEDRYVKSASQFEFQSQRKTEIRRLHLSGLENASYALRFRVKQTDIENRLITSGFFSCRKDQIAGLKLKITELLKEMTSTDEREGHDEVCQISIQLLPLSHT